MKSKYPTIPKIAFRAVCINVAGGLEKCETWGTDPAKGPFFKGFAFLPAGSAHGSTASSLAISFAPRVA